MTLSELQEQGLNLPIEERWQLILQLMSSLRLETQQSADSMDEFMRTLQLETQNSDEPTDDSGSIVTSLVGIAKTDGPAPTDEEVKAMLNERLTKKYLYEPRMISNQCGYRSFVSAIESRLLRSH